MSDRAKMILESASTLSVVERAQIAEALLAGLDAEEGASAEEVEAAWAKEITRRVEDYRNGVETSEPGDQVMQELLAKYKF